MSNTWTITTALAGIAILGLAGCGSSYDQQHNHNAHKGAYIERPNLIIEFPYKYDNVARTCVDGDGIYVGFQGHQVDVVASDRACKETPADQ